MSRSLDFARDDIVSHDVVDDTIFLMFGLRPHILWRLGRANKFVLLSASAYIRRVESIRQAG